VVARHDDSTLVAAIDGVGHGPAAADAAKIAAERLGRYAGEPLEDLFGECHLALQRTRGAVMTAAVFQAGGLLRWAGVGNVEARVVRAAAGAIRGESPVLFGGVLGYQLRTVRASSVELAPGDLVLMATDGVRADFASGLTVGGDAQAVADRIMSRSAKQHDDALVVASRWLGP
jgi:hypothetical protein